MLLADLRKDVPCLGTRKLHFLLLPQLGEHAPLVGRYYRFALLAIYSFAAVNGAW